MNKFIIKLSRTQRIKNLFHRTMVQQKPKIKTNKKVYKREKIKYNEE
jgi:hypothetical protein